MKKNKKVLHTLSTVACSMGAFAGIANAQNNLSADPSYFMDVMDGDAGGTIPTPPTTPGSYIYSATSVVTGQAQISLTVQSCAKGVNQINCTAFFFNGVGGPTTIEPATYQGACSGYTTGVTDTVACTSGLTYNVNFTCSDNSAGNVMTTITSAISFTCS